jgi:hypothetical protein
MKGWLRLMVAIAATMVVWLLGSARAAPQAQLPHPLSASRMGS